MKVSGKPQFMFDCDHADSREDWKEIDMPLRRQSSVGSNGSGKAPLPTILKKPAFLSPDYGQDLSICNTVSSMASASFLDEDPSSSRSIPSSYIRTIVAGFGEDACLYKDVLEVSNMASPRDIRIAYFRRGREVLAEDARFEKSVFQAATVGDVSSRARTRFQAVSMAYEILCNPSWKQTYLLRGLVGDQRADIVNQGTFNDSMSVDTRGDMSVSAKSLPNRPAVRWNERVEELVFDNDPSEHSYDHANGSRRKRKKRRSKVVIAPSSSEDKLDDHLAKLDLEARLEQLPEEEEEDPEYLPDFFDGLEEKLNGVLKYASSRVKKDKHSCNKKSDLKKIHQEKPIKDHSSVATPFDEQEMDDSLQMKILERLTNEVPSDEESSIPGSPRPSGNPEPIDNSRHGRKIEGSPTEKGGPSIPGFNMKKPQARSVETGNDRFVAIVSDTEFAHKGAANHALGVSQSSTNEDVFAGLEEDSKKYEYHLGTPEAISVPPHQARPESPANGSISDLSESVIQTSGSRLRDTVSFLGSTDLDDVDESERDSPENRGNSVSSQQSNKSGSSLRSQTEKEERQTPDERSDTFDLCFDSWAQSMSFGSTKEPAPNSKSQNDFPDGESKEAPLDDLGEGSEQDGFIEYLLRYIRAVAKECSSIGSRMYKNCDWEDENGMFGACVLNDGHMDGVLEILDQEFGLSSPSFTLRIR